MESANLQLTNLINTNYSTVFISIFNIHGGERDTTHTHTRHSTLKIIEGQGFPTLLFLNSIIFKTLRPQGRPWGNTNSGDILLKATQLVEPGLEDSGGLRECSSPLHQTSAQEIQQGGVWALHRLMRT